MNFELVLSSLNLANMVLIYQFVFNIFYLSLGTMIQTWTHEGDKLVTSLVNNKSAHLTLVALLTKPPEHREIEKYLKVKYLLSILFYITLMI